MRAAEPTSEPAHTLGGMDAFNLAEIARRLENMLRVGSVDAADYGRARVRIRCGQLVTGWLPWLTARAGHDVDWWAPDLGEQVLVLSPSGEMANGIVLPALYRGAVPAPETTPDVRSIAFGDGTSIKYDRAAHRLSVSCVGDVTVTNASTITVQSGGAVTVQAPSVTIDTPMCTVSGRLNVGNGMAVTGSVGGSAAATFSGDVVAGGISLTGHTHPGDSGGTTGAPR